MKKEKGENIYNIPNLLSAIRVLASPILVYLAYINISLTLLAILFVLVAITDFADGFIARRYNLVTKFGRKLDMIADRIFMISLIFAFLIYLYVNSMLNFVHIKYILLLLTREILSAPIFLLAFLLNKRPVPHARFAGKLTTTLQGFAFPLILLQWPIAIYAAVITAIAGVVCAGYYIYDALIKPNNEFQLEKDHYYLSLDKGKK
jgi:CDP-diacylglycerol--glycerol-3-phosphate 3-phosphatidyltransferase